MKNPNAVLSYSDSRALAFIRGFLLHSHGFSRLRVRPGPRRACPGGVSRRIGEVEMDPGGLNQPFCCPEPLSQRRRGEACDRVQPHTSADRSCLRSSSDKSVSEPAEKKLMPRPVQYSRKRWIKFRTVCR